MAYLIANYSTIKSKSNSTYTGSGTTKCPKYSEISGLSNIQISGSYSTNQLVKSSDITFSAAIASGFTVTFNFVMTYALTYPITIDYIRITYTDDSENNHISQIIYFDNPDEEYTNTSFNKTIFIPGGKTYIYVEEFFLHVSGQYANYEFYAGKSNPGGYREFNNISLLLPGDLTKYNEIVSCYLTLS